MMFAPLFVWSFVHASMAVLTPILGAIFWVLYKTHTRLKELEESETEREDAVFGNDSNPLHVGLTREVHDLKQEVEDIQAEIDDAGETREELKQKLHRVQRKLDKMKQTLEQLDE